ncbi:MAG: YihY/virulence factor BrkB family protein [Tannerellaceae bacterium]|nr:YihY/virulence factor BrkB family protein [Tannerellaceae bacterium]
MGKKQADTKKRLTFPIFVKIVKDTVAGFNDDNVTRLSASLAYATLFSIIPFVSLLISIGTFFHADIANQLYVQLQPILGTDVVDRLREILDNAKDTDASTLATLVTLGVTIFGATAIFAEIQSSLNTIWGIKAVPKKSWLKYIRTRLLSFSIILIFAFILLITFSISSIIEHMGNRFMAGYPDIAESIVKVIGMVLNFGVTVVIFVLIFKMLPDAKIKSRDVLIGAFVTALLFLIGQWGISFYIGIANMGTVYGAAAFMAILITWIYYSAIIIYIGAEFTESWANEIGGKIFPDAYAVTTKTIEIQDSHPRESAKKIKVDKE